MSDGVGDNKWIPKEEGNTDAADRIVWSTRQIDDLLVAMDQGYRPKIKLPFYEGRQFLKKGNIVFEYTDDEITELARCAKDIVYFAEKYAVVMTDEGIQQVKLRDYQKVMLRNFQNDRFNIVLAARQMGKTVTASIFNAWYVTFNMDKNTLLLANKSDSTKEIIDKAKTVIENLPFFMKPGIIKYDVMNVRCDNGCRLIGQSTTAKSGIGFTIHNLYLDEFAHIHPSIAESFYENVYPTLSSSKVSRITITSTPNGFNKQYGNEFVSSSNLLLDPVDMKKMRKRMKPYVYHDFDEFDYISIDVKGFLEWDPAFDIETCADKENFWVFSVDIAEGNGGDSSVINVFKVEPMNSNEIKNVVNPGAMYDFFKFEQVARFKSNEHVIEDFAKVLYTLAVDIFNSENVKMIVEYNTYGTVLFQYLRSIFPQRNDFDDEMVVKFKHRHDSKTLKPGIKLKSDNKAIFCQNFAKLYKINRLDLTDEVTVTEASLFGVLPNGSYGAQMGNDDIIMTCITATEFFNTTDYADFVEEMLDFIDPSVHNEMEGILYKDSDQQGDLQYDIYDLLK